ncbi:beta-fructofuranosidase, cell wall isozyme-like [Neltuma alba]|uniref:beta-fructofuranosidase, cell wall isozyme-like n=1 Tax=Neltuma alba TaxID=207710 RepID=UPI0010A3472E|nr:beta-fructofuranosidase, cell wall isozyme-like [Prosopis alba]
METVKKRSDRGADIEVSFDANEFGKAEVLDHWVKPQLLRSRKGAAVKEDLKDYTAVFLRVFIYQRKPLVLFCSDQSRSSMNYIDHDLTTYGTFLDLDPSHENLSLRSLIDHSVVESFGGEGRAVITARVYPTMAINDEAQRYMFNYGAVDVKITGLRAWSMKKAQIN